MTYCFVMICLGEEQGRARLGERHRSLPDHLLAQDPRGVRGALQGQVSREVAARELILTTHTATPRAIYIAYRMEPWTTLHGSRQHGAVMAPSGPAHWCQLRRWPLRLAGSVRQRAASPPRAGRAAEAGARGTRDLPISVYLVRKRLASRSLNRRPEYLMNDNRYVRV